MNTIEIYNTENVEENKQKEGEKVGLLSLLIISISSTIGAGIFNIPQNIADATYAFFSLIFWVFTALAIYIILLIYIRLSKLKPKESIYDHGKQLLGNYGGFLIGFGYYVSSVLTICCFDVSLANGMEYFFEGYFDEKENKYNIFLVTTSVLWIFFILYCNGLDKVLFLNAIATICKIFIIIFYIIVLLIKMNTTQLKTDFWGKNNSFNEIFNQFKSTFIICIFCYLGIETSTTLSSKSKDDKLVGLAINIAYFLCSILYLLSSFLSYGIYSKDDLSELGNPSMAGVLGEALGKFGTYIINFGMIISVLSCWLSWNVNFVELFDKFTEDKIVSKFFAVKNKHNIPIFNLLFGTILIQTCLILFTFLQEGLYLFIVNLSTVFFVPCYACSSIYLIYINLHLETKSIKEIILGCLGIVISLILLISFEIKYILLSFAFYILGVILYIAGIHENGNKFNKLIEIIISIVMLVILIVGIIYLIVV